MKIANKTLKYQTKSEFDFIDITEEVRKFVQESRIKNGLVNIQILHTSAGLIVNENEPLLLEDIKKNLENCSPASREYQHDDFSRRTVNVCPGECINGHSHCKAIHLLVNATLNIIKGELQLGQWQNIIFIELDRSRPRKIQLQIIGE
ncbi:MAG: YjbQ family protein [Candidatus Nealsonbacteria bacterium]|nr:YjbQ family protein [Candidatus Nealsonbacteria bacterium]